MSTNRNASNALRVTWTLFGEFNVTWLLPNTISGGGIPSSFCILHACVYESVTITTYYYCINLLFLPVHFRGIANGCFLAFNGPAIIYNALSQARPRCAFMDKFVWQFCSHCVFSQDRKEKDAKISTVSRNDHATVRVASFEWINALHYLCKYTTKAKESPSRYNP